ncbi:MAG: hypothetical protein VX237_03480, partial [Chloroflexota bacterium]|nr:hypothetical protein [Chloroflexota bacterium]
MANVIKIKRSASASDAPTAGQLEYGELAINYNDGKLYYKNSSDAIAEIGGSGEINVQSDWNESSSSEDDFIKNKPTIAYTSAISEGNSGLVPSAGSSGQFLQYNGSWATPSYTTNTDTQLTTEQVQDIVGGMFTSNTETRISATYQDGDGTIDLVVDDMNDDTPAGYNNSNWDTAYGWGDHGLSAQDKTDIGNLSGTNTGDQTLPTRTSLGISTADHVVFNKITVGDDDGIAWSDGSYMKKAGSGDIEIASAGGDLDITTWLRMRASSNGTITGAWHHSAYKMRIGGDVTQTDYNLKIDATPLTAGSLYTAGKITTASHGDSSQWNSAYGWGNHASGGYASNSGNATTSYVDTAIANLVSDAPATLDTLGEIADALNDSNVNVWTAGLNLKANIASPTFTGTVTAPQIDIGSSGAITLNGSTGDPASDGVYGLESNDGYFDTVNSGHDSDALELVYRRGSEVRVGTGANGSKALKAGSLYDGGNRVATQTWVSAQSYGSSNLALGATSSTAYRGDRGTTAYDHSQASHAPSNANLGATVAQGTTADNALARAGGTMTGALHMHQGAYEGLITFGSNATWRCGIRQHDDADAELRIWARSSNGMIFLATGYDGEPAS